MLHVDELGHGPTLILLHGWGVNSRIWQPVIAQLASRFRVVTIDLPGHGQSEFSVDAMSSIDAIADRIAPYLRDQSVVLGWSLGGLIALNLAQRFSSIARVITCASSPKFIAAPVWPGLESAVFSRFSADLSTNYEATINRFLALSLLGLSNARSLQSELLQQLLQHRPKIAALEQGLLLLRDTDYRSQCAAVSQPTLHIFGSLDAIVPRATHDAVSQITAHQIAMIEGAGHIPFLTHTQQFLALIDEFIPDEI